MRQSQTSGKLIVRDDEPVFILGSGRCGSTLLQSIVNSNPEFLIWGEHNGFLRQLADSYYKTNDADMKRNLRSQESVELSITRLRNPENWNAWENRWSSARLSEQFGRFVKSLFDAGNYSELRWGFKEIRYGISAEDKTPYFLLECFPKARFLIIIRNPMQTILSKLLSWYRGFGRNPYVVDIEIRKLAKIWTEQYANLFLFHHYCKGLSRIVRYEDLIVPSNLPDLWSFIGSPEPSSCREVLKKVTGACCKDGEFASFIGSRLDFAKEEIHQITLPVCALYGYLASGESNH